MQVFVNSIRNSSQTEYKFSEDYEVSPKIALNDANLIIKLKNSSNLIQKIGKRENLKVNILLELEIFTNYL